MTSSTLAPADEGGAVVRRQLCVVRRRVLAQWLLYWFGAFLPLGLGLMLAAQSCRVLLGRSGWPFWELAAAALYGALHMTVFMVFGLNTGIRSLRYAAWIIDRRAGTHDRFHTALDFAARGARSPWEELTLAECVRFITGFPVRQWMPIRLPRSTYFAGFPLVSLALLAWHGSLGVGRPPRDPALDAAVARRAAALARLADRLHQNDQPSSQPDLDKVAAAMKRSAERLKESARQGDEQKLKTALSELSSLESMLAAMKQAAQDGKVSPGEIAALAAALQASDPSRAAGESLKNGRLEQAGDQLAKLAEKMKAQGSDAQTLQQLARSMQEQAARLTASERNEVARQMQQAAQSAAGGQSQLSAQSLQRLAELLRRAGRNGAANGQRQASNAPGKSGPPMTEQQLQTLLNSLENMKEGLQPGAGDGSMPGGGPDDGPGAGQSLAAVEAFGQNPSGDPATGNLPAGMPGSEHDRGSNDRLLAEHPADAGRSSGPAKRIEGIWGDGASLRELVGAKGGGPARAGRRYRDLYESIAPAEQNSIEQENIPLGSRFFVRRYFENIRPEN